VKNNIAVIDLETDPFEYNQVPAPFCAGFFNGAEFISIWSEDCVPRIIDAIDTTGGPYTIYAHNGGKFDFFYFLPHLEREMRIVNGRIIQAHMRSHELRDSYAILPFPLKEFDKDDIDYEKMRRRVREHHREEIIRYLRKDCTSLYTLVTAFVAEFGDSLTVGGAALKQLKKRHKFQSGGANFDAKFRTQFYFGGRVQVFKSGIVRQPCQIVDVNSMYPYVMATSLHPIGTGIQVDNRINRNTCFVVAEGRNYGGFPIRTESGSLDFTKEYGTFHTTIHEWHAAEETGAFKPRRVVKTYGFDNRCTFDEFVTHFYTNRKRAKLDGDKIHALFYKYVLNSAYGKFAQNPENYEDWQITAIESIVDNACLPPLDLCSEVGPDPLPCPKWHQAYLTDKYCIWKRHTERRHYYNITTGASITGAARAILLRGLHAVSDPIYCDTDSIICRSVRNLAVDSEQLGSWKLEGEGTVCAIAGKKLYCVIAETETCTCAKDPKECRRHIKQASKGAILTPDQIWHIAKGGEVKTFNPSPAFKFSGNHKFVKRTIRSTAV